MVFSVQDHWINGRLGLLLESGKCLGERTPFHSWDNMSFPSILMDKIMASQPTPSPNTSPSRNKVLCLIKSLLTIGVSYWMMIKTLL